MPRGVLFQRRINPDRLAIYDVAVRPTDPKDLAVLARNYPAGVIRVGLQPAEPLAAPFNAGVEDTWSALCHGNDNAQDWPQPGFGADTLRQWVQARNLGTRAVAWDLVAVAWDYRATERGGYPGYDDAEKNMPLPAPWLRRGRKSWFSSAYLRTPLAQVGVAFRRAGFVFGARPHRHHCASLFGFDPRAGKAHAAGMVIHKNQVLANGGVSRAARVGMPRVKVFLHH